MIAGGCVAALGTFQPYRRIDPHVEWSGWRNISQNDDPNILFGPVVFVLAVAIAAFGLVAVVTIARGRRGMLWEAIVCLSAGGLALLLTVGDLKTAADADGRIDPGGGLGEGLLLVGLGLVVAVITSAAALVVTGRSRNANLDRA